MFLQLRGEVLLLFFQHSHLLLDGIALLPEFSDLFTFGVGTPFDLLANLLADAVAFGLESTALFLQLALLLSDHLKPGEINGFAPTPQFGGNGIGILTHQALVEHGSCRGGAGSLWQADQRTCPSITAATAENTVMPRAVIGFCPWATATVVITPAPRQATASWVVMSFGRSTGCNRLIGP